MTSMAALRLLFVPLFMAIQRLSAEKETWAQNMVLQVLSMALMAFSNGYARALSHSWAVCIRCPPYP